MKTTLRITILLLCLTALHSVCIAQDYLRIHLRGGGHSDVAVDQVDSITFVHGGDIQDTAVAITGSWLWGNHEQGYYELLTFNEDHTYTGYDNYFTYGFDTMTYGWWGQIGAMLTLQSNGYGYQRRYNWFISELTENALAVMTKMGPFTYYKLQSETLSLSVDGVIACDDGDSIIFADGITVKAEDGKLQGIAKGTTYVLIRKASDDNILAFKVVVSNKN